MGLCDPGLSCTVSTGVMQENILPPMWAGHAGVPAYTLLSRWPWVVISCLMLAVSSDEGRLRDLVLPAMTACVHDILSRSNSVRWKGEMLKVASHPSG